MSTRREGRPLIVPFFIPNQGCPHRCIFCHQEKITDRPTRSLDRTTLTEILEVAVRSVGFDPQREPQVAFYGGTFTSLPYDDMKTLLETVKPYLEQGLFKSVRVSTRPDALDNKGLELMRGLGVSTVELGSQSMDDEVLALSKRGHGAEDTVNSVRKLRAYGFRVGIQLMPGLPGDSKDTFKETVAKVIELKPDTARLYPTVVIKGTELARWHREGRYRALELQEAVKMCQESCMRLEENGIPVIRLGLMSSPSLLRKGQIIDGPWHSAFGYLVRSGIHQQKIMPYLPSRGEADRIRIRAPYRDISLIRGYRNRGIEEIEKKTGAIVKKVLPDPSIPSGQIRVDII